MVYAPKTETSRWVSRFAKYRDARGFQREKITSDSEASRSVLFHTRVCSAM